uniref:Uncharacterized protein n=1 Tax=Rhizophora mucronata TaxID=61149 RepID=A0A2P2PTK2_RHIMU
MCLSLFIRDRLADSLFDIILFFFFSSMTCSGASVSELNKFTFTKDDDIFFKGPN